MQQHNLVAQQFGHRAQAYLNSSVHAQGADLQALTELATQLQPQRALDLGCGAGHASFALAQGMQAAQQRGQQVVACDMSPAMLAVVQQQAQARGFTHLHVQQSVAEVLPFEDGWFDLVVTRFSAHHWMDVASALRDMKRVLRAGGRLVVIDVVAPEVPLFDTVLQSVEWLRDVSHVRDYRVSEWQQLLAQAGFVCAPPRQWKLPMEFDTWVKRMATPPTRVAAIREMFGAAPQEAKAYFAVADDDSFVIDVAWLSATA